MQNINQFDFYVMGHSDYIKFALEDILKESNVKYYDFDHNNPFLKFVQKCILSKKIPDVIKKSLCQFLSSKVSGFKLKTNKKNTIFIFYERNRYSHNRVFLNLLKKYNPDAKFIYIYTNLISNEWLKINRENLEFIQKGNIYDLVLTFNEKDAKKYNYLYFDFVNSAHDFLDADCKYDVFFCGRAKGRCKQIHEVYTKLSGDGLKCKFIVIRDSTIQTKDEIEGIDYSDKIIPNIDVLKDMQQSKCILDICFDENEPGQSLRFSEAIAYSKLLLTNNKYTIYNKLYNEKQMVVFHTVSDINTMKLKELIQLGEYLNPDVVSPYRLLEFIVNKLTSREKSVWKTED